jgi:hypothetical protein
MRETIEVVVARIDENVKHIKEDYATESEAKAIAEREVVKHERKQHKRLNIAALTALLTAIATMIGALIYAFA